MRGSTGAVRSQSISSSAFGMAGELIYTEDACADREVSAVCLERAGTVKQVPAAGAGHLKSGQHYQVPWVGRDPGKVVHDPPPVAMPEADTMMHG